MARTADTPTQRQPRRPGLRGWSGRGGGAAAYLEPAPEWRGTTVQVCGLWPYGAGSGTPVVGVPIGRHIYTGSTVCCDPVSWFQRSGLISNPSAFVLGRPGLGKSTLIRRMALGLSGFGVQPLVFGDLRPDYVDLIRALGGQVIALGRGRGYLNILDPGEASTAAARLTGDARRALEADAHGRRLNAVASLITVLRTTPPDAREETLLAVALQILDDRHPGVPVLADLLQVFKDAPPDLRAVALDRGDLDRYRDVTENLESSLTSLLGRGRLGEMFAHPTTEPMRSDRPVCFDISSIDDSDTSLQAAALLACWSYGFGSIAVAQALADAGLERQQHRFVILDELWRVLQAGQGLVDRINALTRLNRRKAVGQVMVTHSMEDLLALPHPEDRAKASGFVERSGLVITAGLPRKEMGSLSRVVEMTSVEEQLLDSWASPPSWDPELNREADPPGRGNFLIKVGSKPGIPVHVELTEAERAINDTNHRWRTA
ncbi:ATP/GTP-binding protein [Streptomyces sp. NPDC018045]|uniref:ATP/GTP-binding protein n=1 Tax=Streptomyces sp. NPDC018045 TaxID=3365037 RepID=UPI0037BD3A99